MFKKLQLKTMALLALLLIGAGSAWATDFTLSSEDEVTVTKDGITVTFDKGSGANAPKWYSAGLRLYAKNTITISAEKNITCVTFNWEQQGSKAFASVTAASGEYTHPTEAGVGTWTGSAKSITFTLGSSGQLQLNTFSVELESTEPAINASDVELAADATSGEIAYTIKNPVDGKSLTASSSTDWISNVDVDAANSKVTFNATENTGVEREGTITLTYGENLATKNVTVTQAAAVTKYTVTIETPTGGTLVVKRGDTPIASGSQIPDGTELTIEATPSDGYKFRNWQAVDASTHTYTATYTYTIGGSDVTIKANFDEIVYRTITWSVNGKTTTTKVEDGQAIAFGDAEVPLYSTKKFVGWVTSSTVDPNEAPEFVKSATATADVTYYAVFADKEESIKNASLTETEITTNINSASMAYADAEKSYNDTADGITWAVRGMSNKDGNWIQIRKNSTPSYIKITAPSNIQEVKVTISNSTNQSGGQYDITKHGAFAGSVCLESSTQSEPSGALGSSNTVTDNVVTVATTGAASSLYIQVTAAARVWGVELTYGSITYSDYTTTIATTETATVTAAGWATYVTKHNVKFPASCTAYVVPEGMADQDIVLLETITEAPAGTPVILESATDVEMEFVETAAAPANGNELKVSDGTTATKDNNTFVLANKNSKVGFYKWGGAASLSEGKVYLQLTGAGAREFVPFASETTGIKAMNNAQSTMRNEVFDLQGRRVAQPQKGLYIVNGKKVVVK